MYLKPQPFPSAFNSQLREEIKSTRYSQLLFLPALTKYTQGGVALFQPEPPSFYPRISPLVVELLTY